MKEIVALRGRRGTDIKAVLRQLENLSKLAEVFGARVEVPILMHVIAAQFDLIRTLDDFMDTSTWKACAVYLNRILVLLEDGREKFTLTTMTPEEDDLMVGNMLSIGSNITQMKAAAQTGDIGARDAVSADVRFINPHTVRRKGRLNFFFLYNICCVISFLFFAIRKKKRLWMSTTSVCALKMNQK